MPSPTSRGYPYPSSASDADVPGDIQALATAINTDVDAVDTDLQTLAGAWRLLHQRITLVLTDSVGAVDSGDFFFVPSDYDVDQIRLRMTCLTNAIAPGRDLRADLVRWSGVTGPSGSDPAHTGPTVDATVTVPSPPASATTPYAGSAVAVSVSRLYSIQAVRVGGAFAAGTHIYCLVELQGRKS